jgi:hypothetical protein
LATPVYEYTARVMTTGRRARQGSDIPLLAFDPTWFAPPADDSAPAFGSDDVQTEQDLKQIVRDARFNQFLTLAVPAPSRFAFFSPGMSWDTLRIYANDDPTRAGNVSLSMDLNGLQVLSSAGRLSLGKFHISRTRYNGFMTRKDPETNAWFAAWWVILSVSPT